MEDLDSTGFWVVWNVVEGEEPATSVVVVVVRCLHVLYCWINEYAESLKWQS